MVVNILDGMSKSQSQSNFVLMILIQDYLTTFYIQWEALYHSKQKKNTLFWEQQTPVGPKFQRNAFTRWDIGLFREMLILNTGLSLANDLGLGISSATLSMTLSYWITWNKRKTEVKGLPSWLILYRKIGHTNTLEVFNSDSPVIHCTVVWLFFFSSRR